MKEWFYCLIEMKGNFYINIGIRNKRVFVQPIFSLILKKEDWKILEMLRNEINVGEIQMGKKAVFVVRGLKKLKNSWKKLMKKIFSLQKKKIFFSGKKQFSL
jgi:hypothetical protein